MHHKSYLGYVPIFVNDKVIYMVLNRLLFGHLKYDWLQESNIQQNQIYLAKIPLLIVMFWFQREIIVKTKAFVNCHIQKHLVALLYQIVSKHN